MSDDAALDKPLSKLRDWFIRYDSKFNLSPYTSRKLERMDDWPEDSIVLRDENRTKRRYLREEVRTSKISSQKQSKKSSWSKDLRESIHTRTELTWLERAASYIRRKNEKVDAEVAQAARECQQAIHLCSHYENSYRIARHLVTRLNQLQNLKVASAVSKAKKEKILREILSVMLVLRRRKQGFEESIDETAESNSSKQSDNKQEEEPEPIRSFGERHDSYGRPLAKLASRMFWESTRDKNSNVEIEEKVLRDLQDFCDMKYLQKIAENNRESGADIMARVRDDGEKKKKKKKKKQSNTVTKAVSKPSKKTKKKMSDINFSKWCPTNHFRSRVKVNRFFQIATRQAQEEHVDKERQEKLKEQSEVEKKYIHTEEDERLKNPPGLPEEAHDENASTLTPLKSADFIAGYDNEDCPALPPGLSSSKTLDETDIVENLGPSISKQTSVDDNLDALPPGLKTNTNDDDRDLPESPSTEFPEPPGDFPEGPPGISCVTNKQ